MPEQHPPDEFLDLVVRSFDSALTPEETARLNELLRSDASCRERYVQHCLHAQMIRKACSTESAAASAPPWPTPQTTRRRRISGGGPATGPWRLALTAAGVLVGFIVLLVLLSSPAEERVASRSARPPVRTPAPRPVVEDPKKPEVPPVSPAPTKPPQDPEELRREKDRIDRELREATKVVQRPAPTPEPDKAPVPVAPRQDKPEVKTQTALAQIEEVAGDVLLAKAAAKAGDPLLAGQSIQTGAGRLVLVFPDKTRVEVGADTTIDEVKTDAGKWISLARGRIFAQVAKQPKDQPMIFATPFGEAKVVGTTLRLIVDKEKGSTRLEVEEGKVQLKNLAGRTVDVPSGHYAVAVAGGELSARTLPMQNILLLAAQGKRTGEEWRLVKDDQAASGSAWEFLIAPRTSAKELGQAYDNIVNRIKNRTAAYVEFKFAADADRDYVLWVRGNCLAQASAGYDQPIYFYDQVLIEFPNAQVSRALPALTNVALANGYAVRRGYWWLSGDAWTDQNATPPAQPQDAQPVIVRFNKSGPQFLRMYGFGAVQRIDAIWLSETQKIRPDDKFTGAVTAPK